MALTDRQKSEPLRSPVHWTAHGLLGYWLVSKVMESKGLDTARTEEPQRKPEPGVGQDVGRSTYDGPR